MSVEPQPRRIISREGTRRRVVLVGLESHKDQSGSALPNREPVGVHEPLSSSVRRALEDTGIPTIRT